VVSVTDFFELIRKVITVDDTMKQYFSDEQLADLAERRAQLGEQAITQVEETRMDPARTLSQPAKAGQRELDRDDHHRIVGKSHHRVTEICRTE
jgi:hypothetical protein